VRLLALPLEERVELAAREEVRWAEQHATSSAQRARLEERGRDDARDDATAVEGAPPRPPSKAAVEVAGALPPPGAAEQAAEEAAARAAAAEPGPSAAAAAAAATAAGDGAQGAMAAAAAVQAAEQAPSTFGHVVARDAEVRRDAALDAALGGGQRARAEQQAADGEQQAAGGEQQAADGEHGAQTSELPEQPSTAAQEEGCRRPWPKRRPRGRPMRRQPQAAKPLASEPTKKGVAQGGAACAAVVFPGECDALVWWRCVARSRRAGPGMVRPVKCNLPLRTGTSPTRPQLGDGLGDDLRATRALVLLAKESATMQHPASSNETVAGPGGAPLHLQGPG
jgi:hypothetical protein